MARYITGKCPGENCPREGMSWSHKQVGVDENDNRVLECEICGCKFATKPAAKVSKKKTTWPYYHEGCGVTFESESHEQKYAKANNLTKE